MLECSECGGPVAPLDEACWQCGAALEPREVLITFGPCPPIEAWREEPCRVALRWPDPPSTETIFKLARTGFSSLSAREFLVRARRGEPLVSEMPGYGYVQEWYTKAKEVVEGAEVVVEHRTATGEWRPAPRQLRPG